MPSSRHLTRFALDNHVVSQSTWKFQIETSQQHANTTVGHIHRYSKM